MAYGRGVKLFHFICHTYHQLHIRQCNQCSYLAGVGRYFASLPANKLELWFALEAERFQARWRRLHHSSARPHASPVPAVGTWRNVKQIALLAARAGPWPPLQSLSQTAAEQDGCLYAASDSSHTDDHYHIYGAPLLG